ncbi:MAG TPA: hypothetical protein VNN17_09100 [Terriglobia bacterium]|nr:hypothetical protein [Terriglobia bacterium]
MKRAHSLEEMKERIELFLLEQPRPVLTEPGRDVVDLSTSSYSLTTAHGRLLWHIWNESTNLVRQITAVRASHPGRLELRYQRFGKGPPGRLVVANSRAPADHLERRSLRTQYLRRLARWLHQLFPLWKLQELTTEPDLARSLSGRYARGWMARGNRAWAILGSSATDDGSASDDSLAYGLLWLDWLRQRHPSQTFEGLKLFLPRGTSETTRNRLAWLHPKAGKWELYETGQGSSEEVLPRDVADFGNLKTRLTRLSAPAELPSSLAALAAAIAATSPQVQVQCGNDGTRRWSLHGLVFARQSSQGIVFGLGRAETLLTPQNAPELQHLVRRLAAFRTPHAVDLSHPFYRAQPERWMQSILAGQLDRLDPALQSDAVYEQVPAVAGASRGLLDLLAVNAAGRLAVIELKAAEDLQLPLQALDYWMRVRWHHQRGDLQREGYFRGRVLRAEPPLLLLVSPALQFHPACDVLLRYFVPDIEVVRIGLNEEWRKEWKVVFRKAGWGAEARTG